MTRPEIKPSLVYRTRQTL